MDKKEFDRIVADSVANGNTREAAEAYVIDGFKIGPEEAAKLRSSGSGSGTKKKAASKK